MPGVTTPSSTAIPRIGVESNRWCADRIASGLLVSESSGVAMPGEGERLFAGVWNNGTPSPAFCAYVRYSSDVGLTGL